MVIRTRLALVPVSPFARMLAFLFGKFPNLPYERSKMGERLWFKHYDEGVPRTIAYPEMTVADLLRKSVTNFPNNPATVFFGATMTYAQLKRDVDRCATALTALGIKQGDRVAIDLPNCPQWIIAWFALQTLGATGVMTNPLYVERELEYQWNDANVDTVIIFDRLWNRVQKIRANTSVKRVIVTGIQDYLPFPKNLLYPLKAKREKIWVEVPRDGSAIFFKDLVAQHQPNPPQVKVSPDDIACLLYTGGTTGPSKGAMLTHRNIVALVNQVHNSVLARSKDGEERMFAVLPFFHSFGLNAVMNVAIGGASALIIHPRFDLKEVLKSIHKDRPTFFAGVPTMFIAMNQQPDVDKYDLTSLKTCFSGAAPLPVEVLEKFEQRTGARITEGYGLTEGTVAETCNPLHGLRKIGSIGIPFPDNDIKIVDVETGTHECPVGETGELILKGPTVMQGYWNKPEETTNAIREGWLFTGDIAKMDEDGFFFIVDRKKDMIIAGGYNVYPRDIEEVLFMHPKVLDAGVIGIPDAYRGETVKAFVVLKPGETATAEEIIAFCREHLAAYKAPKVIEFRDTLPRNLIGKLLRRELREQEVAKKG
jgi:long-chain acyl-CoA synthetase